MKKNNITKNQELLEKIEILISHGISIMSISESTGIIPEEIAKYICLVWVNKNDANKEKLYRGFGFDGNNSIDYEFLLEKQGIKRKEKIMSR